MPIHFEDLDVVSEVSGLTSALIVPCNMCPAATAAVPDGRPFMQFFRSFLKAPFFEGYIKALQSRLREIGLDSRVFRSRLYHHWFLCMWTSARRTKLAKYAKQHDAVIVLGCGSAAETVRDSVQSSDCKVIEGMEVSGIMNAKLRFHFPCNVSFEDCKITPVFGQKKKEDLTG